MREIVKKTVRETIVLIETASEEAVLAETALVAMFKDVIV